MKKMSIPFENPAAKFPLNEAFIPDSMNNFRIILKL
jgi:hypothetical protein